MLVLAFDTAGPDCAVALVRGGPEGEDVIARACETLGRGHAERLLPMIDHVLGEAGRNYTDLDRIAVATGPGSFTGVRVGVAAARALALALDIPAVGVGSLEALACPVNRVRPSGTVIVALDARRGELYALARDIASGAVLFGPVASPVKGITARLSGCTPPFILTGGAAPVLRTALGDASIEVLGVAESPDIADVAWLGLHAGSSTPPLPIYARGADAKPQAGIAVARRPETPAPGLVR